MESEGAPTELKSLPEVQVLKTVWAQQFQQETGKIVYQPSVSYDRHTQIQSPHDPQARHSKKRIQEWVGGKVQATETDDEGYPHIITDITTTCSSQTDYEALAPIQDRLAKRKCLPAEQYVDSGYMSRPNLEHSQKQQIALIGSAQAVVSKQTKIPDGITTDQFTIDLVNKRATCPAGHTIDHHDEQHDKVRFSFPRKYVKPAYCAHDVVQARAVGQSAWGKPIRFYSKYVSDRKPRSSSKTTTNIVVARKAVYPLWRGVTGCACRVISVIRSITYKLFLEDQQQISSASRAG